MQYKESKEQLQIKEEGEGIRRISGYASVFGNVDSHNDVIARGAFMKSIEKAQSRPLRLFSSHDMDAKEMLGTIDVLREDERGLYFEAEISQAPSAQDIALKAKEGHLNEVSIGFFLKDASREKGSDGKPYQLIKEADLIEISLVSRASNPEARLLMVKEEETPKEEPKMAQENLEQETKNEEIAEVEASTPELPTEPSQTKQEENTMTQEKDELLQEMAAKLEKMEAALNTPVRKSVEPVEEPKVEVKSEAQMKEEADELFCQFIKGEISKREYQKEVEQKALSSVIVENGGALVPSSMFEQLIIERDRINKLERLCNNVSHVGPLDVADYSFNPTWANHDEGDTISETSISSIFGKNSLDPQDQALLFPVPKRLERRAFRALAPLLAQKAAAAHNDKKEDKILLGSGNNEPLGIVTMLDSLGVNTESVTALANIDYTALVNCTFKLREEYRSNAVFVMHPDAIAQVMKLTDSQGLPIWTHGRAQDGVPPRLLGYPVLESRALADGNASGESPVLFGDFSFYLLQHELEFAVESSEHSSFNKNQIDLRMVVSYDGMPVDQKAFARIEIS